MTRYTWPSPGQNEESIVGSRLSGEINQLGIPAYAYSTAKDAALAELLATAGAVLNVRSFGAVGDGVADDTAAIEAADAAAVSGALGLDGVSVLAQGVVYFPPGTYKHTGLTYRGAPWMGAGWHVTTLSYTGSGASINAVGTTGARKTLNIVDLRISGASASTGAYGLRLGHNYRSPGALRRVYISDFPSYGIYFAADSWIMSFYDVYCVRNDGSGIAVDAAVSTLASLEWYNLILENNGTAGASVAGGIELDADGATNKIAQWAFFGGTWEGNAGAAEARFIDCESVSLYGIYFEADLAAAGAVDGLVIGGFTNAIVSGARIHAVASHAGVALKVTNTAQVTLDNSHFHTTNWPTHVKIEDTATVALVSEGNLGTSHVITIADGAAFSRLRPQLVALTDQGTIPVNAALGEVFAVTLTENRAMGQPTNPSVNQRITFVINQDGSGGRALTWHSDFKHVWSDTGNTLSKRSTISFRYYGNRWQQEGAQSAYYS